MKEKWFAVSGVWTKTLDGKVTTVLKQKIYDDVVNAEEALGKFTNECVNGPIGRLENYSLMLWQTTTLLVPKEITPHYDGNNKTDELTVS